MSRRLSRIAVCGLLLLIWGTGCATTEEEVACDPTEIPHELAKVSLPPYVIESPDILQVNAIRLIPKPPYKIEPLDSIGIQVVEALPEQPITGVYPVEPNGKVNLGFTYGSVFVQGMTLEQAKQAIQEYLKKRLKPGFTVTVTMGETRALQLIRGIHLVQTDGTVNLGLYGSVYVDNMTIPQAKAALEAHLSQFLVNPEIALTVSGYNSKVFYIVTEGAGVTGDQITRLPIAGKTTVLDALGLVNGLPAQVSLTRKMWLVRPAPAGSHEELVLPIDFKGIVKRGQTATNYQILPGDRLFVKADPFVATDAYLGRILAPIDRILGTALLSTGLISSIQQISTFRSATTTTTTTIR